MLRPTQIRQYVNFMQSRGYAVEDVLANSGIDAPRLTDSSYLVQLAQCHVVVANMIRLTADPGIGMQIGASTNINDLGIVGYAMVSSSTLEQAIALWLQYGKSPIGSPLTLHMLAAHPDCAWGVTTASNGVSGSIYRFYLEETVTMGMSFGRMLTGRTFEMAEVEFAFPAPPHARRYEEHFNCRIVFDAPMTRILVKSPSLATPVKSNDSELRELCVRHCSHLVRYIARNGPVASRLRSALTTLGTIPSLESSAEMLNMSPRSLRRHLHVEDTSFQVVLDEFRLDLASEYLLNGMMPAKEVAFLLGFSHVDAFRRAFRTWTGMTVGEFQNPSQRDRRAKTPELRARESGFALLA